MDDEMIARLRGLVRDLPDSDFEVWTSNSWRRVYFQRGGPAIEPSVQRTDNHPDLIFASGVAEYLEAVGPKRMRMMLDLIDRQARDIAALMEDNSAQAKLATEACAAAARDRADAERYRWLQARVFADQGRRGRAYFGLPLPLPLGDPFKGSVAQHFDETIDASISNKQEG